MNTGHRTIVALLTVIAVLLALNLVVTSSPAGQAEGDLRRCCFPHPSNRGRAVHRRAALSPRKADLVKMRVIWGLDLKQISESLGVSIATVSRDWRFAKAWLSEAVGLPSA